MPVNVTFDSINVGGEIPAWSRETDFMSWNRYAAVNDEFVHIQMNVVNQDGNSTSPGHAVVVLT
jgi:hypothetical protein